MPIYEYACENCGHKMEALQKMADPALQDCPECQQPALKKLISAVAFRLKGSGWYETDFKSGDKKNLVDAGKTDNGKSSDDKKESSDKSQATDKKDAKSSSSESQSTDNKSTSSASASPAKKGSADS